MLRSFSQFDHFLCWFFNFWPISNEFELIFDQFSANLMILLVVFSIMNIDSISDQFLINFKWILNWFSMNFQPIWSFSQLIFQYSISNDQFLMNFKWIWIDFAMIFERAETNRLASDWIERRPSQLRGISMQLDGNSEAIW